MNDAERIARIGKYLLSRSTNDAINLGQGYPDKRLPCDMCGKRSVRDLYEFACASCLRLAADALSMAEGMAEENARLRKALEQVNSYVLNTDRAPCHALMKIKEEAAKALSGKAGA